MSQPAYIYARFSTAEQSKGHSLERQISEGRAFVERMGWSYDPSRNLVDEGRSAFHGVNREEGSELFTFEEMARQGQFRDGVVLAVENLDRLTRQGYEECFDLLRMLTKSGVTVATWHDSHIFPAGQGIDAFTVMKLILGAERAREESEAKSKRLKSAWQRKFDAALAGERKAITKILPGWLEVDPVSGKPIPIPHRVDVLNEIFDWYCEGKGLPWIERELNRRGEPNWGRGKHSGKPWGVDRLHRHLTSRAVLGEFAPRMRVGGEKVSRGVVIPDYYPQVISTEKFNRAQSVRKQRRGWGGKNQYAFPNLFTGIATCSECRGKMTVTSMMKAGTVISQKRKSGNGRRSYTVKQDKGYLACRNALRGLCSNKMFYPYYPLEAGVLSCLWDLAMKGEHIKPNGKAARLSEAVADCERGIDLKRSQIATLVENLSDLVSQELTRRLVELEAEVEQEEAQLRSLRDDLGQELAKAPAEHDLEALSTARGALLSSDPEVRYGARTRTHQALQRLIDFMDCEPNGNTVIVFGNYAAGMTFDRMGTCLDASGIRAWPDYIGDDSHWEEYPPRTAQSNRPL